LEDRESGYLLKDSFPGKGARDGGGGRPTLFRNLKTNITMKDEIRKILEKELSAEAGSVLKAVLEQGELDAANLKDLEKKHQVVMAEKSDLEQRLNVYKSCDIRNAGLEAREKALELKERDVEIDILKLQLAVEKEKTEFVRGVSMGLVRNIEYRKSVFENEHTPSHNNNAGHWVADLNKSKSFTEEKKAE
jgi:hypothetical protein